MIKTIDLDKFHKDKSSSIHAEFEYLMNHDVIKILRATALQNNL